MSMFSQFYSASEAEAANNLRKLMPQQPEGALPFSDSDAEELSNLLNGTVVSTPRPRNDVNQPLFLVQPAGQSAGVLTNEPSFAIYEERVIRDKNVGGYAGDSDESEWAARSRTPSSDQRSPQEAQAPSSASSVKGGMSIAIDISNDRRETKRPGEKQMSSLGSASRYHATYPQMVLQNMDTQFSKWSYDLKEGYTAIPFVTARVPPELHRKMVENDKKYWVSGIEDLAGEQTDSQDIVKPTLEGHHNLRRFNTNILITLVAQVIGEERVIWKDVVQICCSTDGIPCWNTARREMLLAGSKLGLDVDIETVYMREAESPDKPIRNNDEFVEAIEYLTSRQYASATLVASAEVAKAATSEPVDGAASKRAAFIARDRAAKNSSLVVSKSAGQKRSALQKNKKRKPIMSSPPPTPRKQEPTTKPAQEPEQQPTQQPQQSRSTFIYLDSNTQDERHEVDTALQKQSIDFESGPDMERWMHHLSKLKKARDEGRVLGEVEAPSAADGSQDGVIQGQGSKLAGRLKGKARKTAKGDGMC